MKQLRQQGGFTLLEILIVIIIAVILVALIVPTLANGPRRTRDLERKRELRELRSALETYYQANNSYPTAGGASCTPADKGCLGKELSTGDTPYLKAIPSDPSKGRSYTYTPSPSSCAEGLCTSYTLTAKLENKRDSQAVNGTYTVNSAY